MCLAIPGKIKTIKNNIAQVDFSGVIQEANTSLMDVPLKKNDYVLIHAGFVIQKLLAKDAREILKTYEELSKFSE